ncbi:Crp/Fnr family transcriptional regulator, partial [Pedobacter sp.]|uniref:Crp/Fnr family transcriptional regulator n=1 Tax=Pedobacter sp. TaxID=1411316 RepID=UPI003C589221
MVREENFLFLIGRLSAYTNLSAAFLSDLRACLVEKTYRHNQFVLSAGHQQNYLWFIVSGFAREVSFSELPPYEPTTWLWFSGELIFQYGFFGHHNSLVDIQVYRDSIILEISDQQLHTLKKLHPEIGVLAEHFRFLDYKTRKQYTSDLMSLKRLDHIRKIFNSHKSI